MKIENTPIQDINDIIVAQRDFFAGNTTLSLKFRKEQLKKLGSSCDWSRLAFTMDEKCSKAVKEVFVNLYEKGLIYRGDRIINWCPDCKTALSDAEVEYVEEDSSLWYIKYPVKDSDQFVTVATSRPETMFGDTAVAVNPKDESDFQEKSIKEQFTEFYTYINNKELSENQLTTLDKILEKVEEE